MSEALQVKFARRPTSQVFETDKSGQGVTVEVKFDMISSVCESFHQVSVSFFENESLEP